MNSGVVAMNASNIEIEKTRENVAVKIVQPIK